jgi:hypothetical protein
MAVVAALLDHALGRTGDKGGRGKEAGQSGKGEHCRKWKGDGKNGGIREMHVGEYYKRVDKASPPPTPSPSVVFFLHRGTRSEHYIVITV